MEVFLYRCEICENVICLCEDYGIIFLHMCKSCNGGTFHEKIVIKPAYDMFGVFQGNRFAVEEKKDGNREKQVDEH